MLIVRTPEKGTAEYKTGCLLLINGEETHIAKDFQHLTELIRYYGYEKPLLFEDYEAVCMFDGWVRTINSLVKQAIKRLEEVPVNE